MRKLLASVGAAAVMATGMAAAAPTAANALAVYNSVYNSTRSEGYIPVTFTNSSVRRNLSPGSRATGVAAFYVAGGCMATSQWGHVYERGWHYFTTSNNNLSLLQQCTLQPA
jgi:hypothetical protein